MDSYQSETVTAAISCVEAHLNQKLSLDRIAEATGYSKYHLHRMFTGMVGLTPHHYIRRRQLTEAARLLVFSEKPVIEIALLAGYESQQAFTTVFKSMYKQTPAQYRKNRFFYPLQLAFTLQKNPSVPCAITQSISRATPADLPDWMPFLSLVIDGFPCLEETSHLEQVRQSVLQKQTFLMRDGAAIIGAAVFSDQTGMIDFLAVHPQYRRYGIMKAFLDCITGNLFGRAVSIVTFRAGDQADTGQRAAYQQLGFIEAELLTVFGYPAQRLVLPPKQQNGVKPS